MPAQNSPGLLPGAEIGYDQITGSVTISSSTEATGTTVIAGSAHYFDGGPVIATFFASAINTGGSANDTLFLTLFEASTEIGRLAAFVTPAANSLFVPVFGSCRFTPTAGMHTYSVTGFFAGHAGAVNVGAGGTGNYLPAFIRFAKV